MTATDLVLGPVTSQDHDENVQRLDVMTETRTVTVGEIVTVMIIVEEIETTTDESGKIIYAATGTLIGMMTQGDGEMMVSGMKDWLPDANENTVIVSETDRHAKRAGSYLMIVMGDVGLSWRNAILVTSEALVVTGGRVFRMKPRKRMIARTASVIATRSGRKNPPGWTLIFLANLELGSSVELLVKESLMAYKRLRRA